MKLALINELKAVFNELCITALIVSHNPHELNGIAEQELIIKSNPN